MTASLSRYLVCALLAIAMLPAAAQAAAAVPVPASDALTTSAHALAVARWGVEPCGGQVAVTWAHMGAGINARSTWMSVDIHNPATYSQCSIAYNLDIDWDWPKLCTVIEHELGHLAGHEHVNDPHNVMSPYYVFPTPECAGALPGAQPAPAAPVAVAQTPAATTPGSATSKRKVVKRKVVKRGPSRRRRRRRRRPRPRARRHARRAPRRRPLAAAAAPTAQPPRTATTLAATATARPSAPLASA